MKYLICALVLIPIISCSQHSTGRMPASTQELDFISPDLLKTTALVRDLLSIEDLPIGTCHNEIKNSFEVLSKVP
ncbi:MAG: hypothetical protein NXH75_12835, partial [Halobacteriovoraceae bacterium]|nr:hypothetical protein [Halobacteriovoraceae bacterium]